jgi:hypothetical protein
MKPWNTSWIITSHRPFLDLTRVMSSAPLGGRKEKWQRDVKRQQKKINLPRTIKQEIKQETTSRASILTSALGQIVSMRQAILRAFASIS